MSKNDIVKAIRDLRALKALQKQIEEELKRLEKLVQSYMEESGEYVVDGDDCRATWSERKQSRFDSAAFKVEFPELYSRFTVQSVGRVFKVQ